MPSPFPGMDPYLEGSIWMTVHSQVSVEIARQLSPKLRPKYLALTTERFVQDDLEDVAVATRSLYPDVGVARTPQIVGPGTGGEGIRPAPLQMATVVPTNVPHLTVEIRDRENRALVTAIEVLSPTNKRGDGREEYLNRRRKLLVSTAHLLEIDLLQGGERVPMRQPLPPAHYFVLLSRFPKRPVSDVWPIRLEDRLPTVPVPLLEPDPDVSLDLQEVLDLVYDQFNYDLAVDYSKPPRIELAAADSAWVDRTLHAAGKRPGPAPM